MEQSFNWIDALVGASICFLAFKGYRKGLIRQVVSLAGLVVGFLFSSKLATLFEQWLVRAVHIDASIARMVSYSLAFIAIVWLANMLSRAVHRAIRMTPFSLFNRLLGALISPAITLILLSYCFVLIDTVIPPTQLPSDPRTQSRCYVLVKSIVPNYIARYWEELPFSPKK